VATCATPPAASPGSSRRTKPGGINNRGQITGAYPSTVEQAGRTT
jgi:hypothetical protein